MKNGKEKIYKRELSSLLSTIPSMLKNTYEEMCKLS